ncbi:hypothetical protein [Sinorhizobium medicae]
MPTVGKAGTPSDPIFIFDEGAPNPYANFITELVEEDGIIRVGLASLSKDGDGQQKAMIVVRLHLKKETAWELCRGLRRMEEILKRRKE